ncbi:MAG: threonine ammonia-lyase IlvA [Bacteroidota bacterium]
MILDIAGAARRFHKTFPFTPLELNHVLSEKYECEIWLKREDRQVVRSYKIRGAFNRISSLTNSERSKGVICASAGNHAQGVAYCCKSMQVQGTIFMPANTPNQKIERVREIGSDMIEIILIGDNYDTCFAAAVGSNMAAAKVFIHAFDDHKVIEGQGITGLEITEQLAGIDYLFLPVGGGGLAAGLGTWFKENSAQTILIGVEPEGAASMQAAFENGYPVSLDKIDPFVDGAAVEKVGFLNYPLCKEALHHLHTVPEGKASATLLELYNKQGIVAELAGCLSVTALDDFAGVIRGKKLVCIISGGNNDALRIEEIKKVADSWEGLHHFLMIRFKHQPDGLMELFVKLLNEHHYITRLAYDRREHGRSTYGLVGIRSRSINDYKELLARIDGAGIEYKQVTRDDFLFKYLV